MFWEKLIDIYDKHMEVQHICPIAHTQITAYIGVLLDEESNFLAGAKIKQSIFAPCTEKSEYRTNNIAPHLVHDNASYVTNINPKRHDAYMQQLSDFVANTNDGFCKIVLKYLQKDTICDDLQCLINLRDNLNFVITFGIEGWEECTVNQTWTNYYMSKLPKNGICCITGERDYIPSSYPKNIRTSSDAAKLFVGTPWILDSMSQLQPGYIASQKIIHTLQSFFVDWEEQGEISLKDTTVVSHIS